MFLTVVALAACGTDGGEVEQAMDGSAGGFVRTAATERGRQLYERHGCVECHGAEGRGDGPISRSLKPPPRDFRQVDGFRHGYSIDEIASTIRDGVKYERRVMPQYAHLSVGDRRSLAVYIRSLADSAAVE